MTDFDSSGYTLVISSYQPVLENVKSSHSKSFTKKAKGVIGYSLDHKYLYIFSLKSSVLLH